MSTVTESVDVEAPVHTVYNQWTQFEEFPNFMDGVERVTQLDDRHNHSRVSWARDGSSTRKSSISSRTSASRGASCPGR
jgi:uncharacterized membrane protein